MLRDLWTAGSCSHGSKVPSDAIFASRVTTNKSVQYRFSNSCCFNTISVGISHLQKIFRNKLPAICKKNEGTKILLSSKLKLGHKNWFNSYYSSKTHTGDKKAISISLPKPQEHTFARWRERAYGHWAQPG